MPLVVFLGELRQDGTRGEVRTVCFYTEGGMVVWGGKNRRRRGRVFESVKSGDFVGSPFPLGRVFSEVKERSSEMREVSNEAAVEVGETQEGLDLGDVRRRRPVFNSSDLDRIH